MHLAALSAGEQAPRGHFNGAVHSVFRQACNIRLDDGRMLTLLASQLGNVPHGVRVVAPPGFDFARRAAPTQRVGCRADVLRLAGGLSIDLATARAWRSELPTAGVDLTVPAVARAWRAAWRAWRRGSARAHHADIKLLNRAVEREAVRLTRAARGLQVDEAASALNCLIGRGPGLTPSGDDVIIGLLAGLWSTAGERPARRAFLEALGAAVGAAAAATSDISRAYLAHAVRGRFAEPLLTLVHRIGAGADRHTIDAALAAALRIGHTSGGDGVLGLLLGLGAWACTSPCGAHPPGNFAAGLDPDSYGSSPAGTRVGSGEATPLGCRVLGDSKDIPIEIRPGDASRAREASRGDGHPDPDPAGRRRPGGPAEAVAVRIEMPAGRRCRGAGECGALRR